MNQNLPGRTRPIIPVRRRHLILVAAAGLAACGRKPTLLELDLPEGDPGSSVPGGPGTVQPGTGSTQGRPTGSEP